METKSYVELEIGFDIIGYYPAQEAPICQDHDDPRYSDPGHGEEVEFEAYFRAHDTPDVWHRVEIPRGVLYDNICKQIMDDVLDVAREQHQNELEDAIIMREEMRRDDLRMEL